MASSLIQASASPSPEGQTEYGTMLNIYRVAKTDSISEEGKRAI